MIRTRLFYYLLIFIVCLCGCENRVMIRIANRSDVEIQNVVVNFPSQTETYGNIPSGKTTKYHNVKKAYRYARIAAVVDGKEALIQPQDYVGESLLSNGKYTYSLTYNPKAMEKYDRIRLELENDN